MAEAEYTTTAKLPVGRIWDFVAEMDNWARFVTGYQSHEKRSETESRWTLKGDVGVLSRKLVFEVEITEWSPGKRAAFRLKGVNEPMEGEGVFTLEPAAGGEAPSRARAASAAFFLRLLRSDRARAVAADRPRAASRARARGPRHAPELPPAPRSGRADGAHDQRHDEAADVAGGRESREPDPRPSRSADGRRLMPLDSNRSLRQMIAYDPFSEDVIRDPYPIYARLREEAPCYHVAKWDCWALSRFEDIWNASMDAESYTTTLGTTAAHLLTKVQPVTPMINLMDPPQHTLLRSRIARFFTPGVVARLEPQIRGFVEEAFAPLAERGGADLFNEFAANVSVKVACLANGFPLEDSDMLNRMVWRFFGREEGVQGMTPDGLAAMMEMTAYFAELIQKRRKAGDADRSVIDALLDVEIDGRKFSDEEAGSHLSMFLIGGAETFPEDLLERDLPALAAQGAAREVREGPEPDPGRLPRGAAVRHADAVPDARAQQGPDAAR